MKPFLAALSIMIPLTNIAHAQKVENATLVSALHCIRDGDHDWLGSALSTRPILHAAAVADNTSYPGHPHLIIAVYSNGTSGQVYDVERSAKAGKKYLRIENNAAFSLVNGEIVFDDPPLGGVWTQDHLVASLKRIMSRTQQSFMNSTLMAPQPNVVCSSYATHKQ